MVNRLVAWVLRSPFSGLLDRSVMLLSLKGRRTGREYTLPVNYADDGDHFWVIAANPERKTWWRNLEEETEVRLHWRGTDLAGTARALRGEEEETTVEAGLRVYLRRFPRSARALAIGSEKAARRMVIVRIVAKPDQREESPETAAG